VLGITDRAKREAVRIAWVDQVVQEGNQAFGTFSETAGSSAATLRQRVTGQRICSILLSKKRKEQFPDERTET
jgi:hypothetical protein